jgi:hypothetical protein
MKYLKKQMTYSLLVVAGAVLGVSPSNAADVPSRTSVKMTVTASVADGKRTPDINPEDVVVQRGKQRLRVTGMVPAQGAHAGLDLFILIDDASTSSLGAQFDDLRKFINAQPSTTAVGVGYMRNATVQVAQDLTIDHVKAVSALRLPLGYAGAYGSPYLSAVDLMKRWPDHHNRREIVMITDGIDSTGRGFGLWRGLRVNSHVDSASAVAQRTGTIIHTIYTPGTGRSHRNYWEATSGQMDIARLADQTGGESSYLGLQDPISFAPYLDQLQKILDNQYLLSFSIVPGKKPGLQRVKLSTPIAGVELSSHDSVWVPALKQAE